ncbi:MAP kinase-activated protein kinase 5-like [Mizuhopecten yessoensis]|uniref:non-specific serine/threonine protein kinase n=1 Tax=Mizuhopecten yessoensis TaxID=6573 RepID=A0A210Q6H0_MIZYE|nr:MAP kinase-activated protein kinase 5-like [Mizuhopecten yessoensis]OWF44338.1 MAP kinase-activated protein kinase 5 [Mizuhopecten yessoensis]
MSEDKNQLNRPNNEGPRIKTSSIVDDYVVQWNQKLGTGISGPVRPCTKRNNSKKFALKCLLDSPKARTEVNLHTMCSGHDNIVSVFDVYANDIQFPGEPHARPRLLVVLEYMQGGELFDRISKESGFTERKAAKYLRQIANAVLRCHTLNIAHRDLKPENLLIRDNTEDSLVKLTDFGFAKIDDGNLQTPHFTPYYVAPQVLEAHKYQAKQKRGIIPTSKPYTYDKSCDMWSMGVILYIMLCGYPPFYSETPTRQITSAMRKKILSGQYEFPEDDWQFISDSAKDVVKSLLHVDPSFRMNIQELLGHPWLNEAPDNKLQSPAVFMDKIGMEDIKLAHSQHLTTMRIPDNNVTLKPLTDTENPIFRKRKLRQTSIEDTKDSLEPSPQKVKADNLKVRALRDIIAYCVLPPKVDDDESVLNNLVTKAMQELEVKNGICSVLDSWKWDGRKFQKKVEKAKLAQELSLLVRSITESNSHTDEPDS